MLPIFLSIFAFSGLIFAHHTAIVSGNRSENNLIFFKKMTTTNERSFEMNQGFYLTFSYWFHFFVRFSLTYISFSVMHDAAHDSIARPASGATFLNPLLGWSAALCFGAPFAVFRSIHLNHHRYTNDDQLDADLWAGGNFRGTVYSAKRYPFLRYALLPLRCATQLYHYLYHALKYMVAEWPPIQFFRDVSLILVFTVFPLVSVMIPKFNYFFWMFHLPMVAAVLILGMFFDYLPHRPHSVNDNPVLSTALITLKKPTSKDNNNKTDCCYSAEEIRKSGIDWLTIPLLSQNFHPVHHLFPSVPFYRYSAVYYRMAKELQDAGLKAHPLFPLIISCDDE
jgi:beta-carotene hydroxylase